MVGFQTVLMRVVRLIKLEQEADKFVSVFCFSVQAVGKQSSKTLTPCWKDLRTSW